MEADDGGGDTRGVWAGVVGRQLEAGREVDVAGDGGAAWAQAGSQGQVGEAGDEVQTVEVREVDLYAVFAGRGRGGGGVEVGVYVAALLDVRIGTSTGERGRGRLTRMASFSIKTTVLL